MKLCTECGSADVRQEVRVWIDCNDTRPTLDDSVPTGRYYCNHCGTDAEPEAPCPDDFRPHIC